MILGRKFAQPVLKVKIRDSYVITWIFPSKFYEIDKIVIADPDGWKQPSRIFEYSKAKGYCCVHSQTVRFYHTSVAIQKSSKKISQEPREVRGRNFSFLRAGINQKTVY